MEDTRPSRVRCQELTDALRCRIVTGEWKPGDQVPTRRDMRREYGASMMTVQRALAALEEEGFVESQVGRGTHVVDAPPHTSRYGLVLMRDANPDRSNFARSLQQTANRDDLWAPHRFTTYPDVGRPGYSRDYERLENDVTNNRLAGIILWPAYGCLQDTPVTQQEEVPFVRLTANPPESDEFAVQTDPEDFLNRVLDHLVECDRRRVAFLWKYTEGLNGPEDLHERIRPLLDARDMITKPLWIQGFKHTEPRWGANWIRLMMLSLEDTPDALVIGDDNLVEPVTRGLRDAGVKVPEELEVIAHCNFPHPTPAAVSVTRLGFSVPEVLDRAVTLINAQRQGQTTRATRKVPVKIDNNPDLHETAACQALSATSPEREEMIIHER